MQHLFISKKHALKLTSVILLSLMASCSNSDVNPVDAPPPPVDPVPVAQFSDAELLIKIQKDPLKYFVDYADPKSRLARERYIEDNPGLDANIITTGGSGFGIINILVGIKNGYISRDEAVTRFATMLQFLETADRFHGAWPHWMEASTGKVIPFSSLDNGGDLVETAFLVQGLICMREYFKSSSDPRELALASKAEILWKGVEWDWYTQNNQNVLYWHWSPNNQFAINLKVEGYNECLITYVLASASPTHTITRTVYDEGWGMKGAIKNAGAQYGIPVVANHAGAGGSVGPLFFSHYSFLGIDPNGLSDQNLNYENVVKNHAKINFQYAVSNPKNFAGYNSKSWGLTASYSRNNDGSLGYNAHSVVNDTGVMSPTATLSSFPYTPAESLSMLKFLYNEKFATYVGSAGPYDAYSPQFNWVTKSYLAIDQGTIAPMVENYKSGFVWNLFMNAPEVKQGLIKLGFHSAKYGF